MTNGRNGISRDSKKFVKIFQKLGFVIESRQDHKTLTRNKRKIKMLMACLGIKSKMDGGQFDLYWQQQISPKILSAKNIKYTNPLVRVHDLFPITNPEWFTIWGRIYFRLGWNMARKDSVFICNSQSTRKVLLSLDPSLASRSFVIYCPTAHILSVNLEECKCQGCVLDLNFSYYLAVGTVEPRKNYKVLLESFYKMHIEDESSKLVIVGKYGWKQSKIFGHLKSLKIDAKVVYIEECCDSALKTLFENASAFVSASLDEGFNIPAAEARSLGVPLILTDIAVHQEFHHGNAYFFNVLKIDEIWQMRFEDLSSPSVNVLDSFDKDVARMGSIIDRLQVKE